MMKKKILAITLIICLFTTGIFYVIYNHTKAPHKVIEDVLEQISITSLSLYESIDLDEYEDSVTHEYSCYFTKTGFEQALARRYFSRFYNPDIQMKDIKVEDVSLNHSKCKFNDITISGTFRTVYATADNESSEEYWTINARLIMDNGKWLINALRILKRTS